MAFLHRYFDLELFIKPMEIREDMLLDVEKLTEVRKQIRFISGVIDSMVFPTDSDRMSYLFTELDSLITVLKLSEGNSARTI